MMDDPGDNAPPPGRQGARHVMYGPFLRNNMYADHGDHVDERPQEEPNHPARVGARGDVVNEGILPGIGLAMLNAAIDRMSVVSLQTNSDESIVADEPANNETASTSRVRNIFRRCCNTDTSSTNGTESNGSETPSMQTVNDEILTDLQAVDLSSSSFDTTDDPDINEVRTSELTAMSSGNEINNQDEMETGETSSKEVIQLLMNDMLDQAVPEAEKVVMSLLDEMLDKVSSMEPLNPGISEVLQPKEKKEKKSKIRRMLSVVLCKKGAVKTDSVSSLSTGSEEEQHEIEMNSPVNAHERISIQTNTSAFTDDLSNSQRSGRNVDSQESKKTSKKSKTFRLFKGRNKDNNKGPKPIGKKIHPNDAASTSCKAHCSHAAADESHGNCPRMSPGQTELSRQREDTAETPAITELPRKPKGKNIFAKMCLYFICLGSAFNEIETDDDYIPSAEANVSDETTLCVESH